jgi:tRNA(Ile)-lysidine synthase TilS/MesJ
VIAAVSGGADSVCLVHALREAGVGVVGLAHFNLQIAGQASEEDEEKLGTRGAGFDIGVDSSFL